MNQFDVTFCSNVSGTFNPLIQRATPKTVAQIKAEINQLKQLLGEEMELFLVAVVLNPTQKEQENGAVPLVVVEPKAVLARDKASAQAKALKSVPKEYENADARLEVRVVQFQR